MINTRVVSTGPSWPGYTEHRFGCGHTMTVKDTDEPPVSCPEPHDQEEEPAT